MKLPQLTLRELFLLVALAAMGCGWWVDRRQRGYRYDTGMTGTNFPYEEDNADGTNSLN